MASNDSNRFDLRYPDAIVNYLSHMDNITEEQAFELMDSILKNQKKPAKLLENLLLKYQD